VLRARSPQPLPSDRVVFARAFRDAVVFPAWIVSLSVVGIGSLAQDAGFPAATAALSTLLVWAAPAQVLLFAGMIAGTPLAVLAVAIGLSSIRFLPMAMAILPLLRSPGQRTSTQFLAAHFVAVTVWVESLRRLPAMPQQERVPYFFGFALGCIGLSTVATYAGYYLVGALATPLAAGLLFLTPIFFTISLVAGARGAMDWAAIAAGFGLTPVATALVGRDFDLVVLGVVGGTGAYLVGRMRRA
jgi:predicted branched-subunit amino acid permease